jgi:hypothetical protein
MMVVSLIRQTRRSETPKGFLIIVQRQLAHEMERKIIMKILSLKYLSVVVLLLSFLVMGRAGYSAPPSEKAGTLVVLVTLGDVDNTPANDAYVEAYGFVRKDGTEKSFVLKSSRAGQYETSLPPGVYDVFVSEGISEPRCRRVLIRPGSTGQWILKLETDEVYTEK